MNSENNNLSLSKIYNSSRLPFIRSLSFIALFAPALIVYINMEGTAVQYWWGLYVYCAGVLPIIIIAYLLYPSNEKIDQAEKMFEKIGAWDDWAMAKESASIANGVIAQRYAHHNYTFPFIFLSAVCYIGFYVIFASVEPLFGDAGFIDDVILSIPIEVFYGFFGGCLFVLYSFITRYKTADIPPSLVLQSGYQIILATASAYFLVTISPDAIDAAVAFSTGFIPYRTLAEWFKSSASVRLGKAAEEVPKKTKILKERENLFHMPGVSKECSERLKEEGVFTIHDMIVVNPLTIYFQTSFKMAQIVSWINQAYLRVFIRNDKAIARLAGIGVLGVIGLSSKPEGIAEDDWKYSIAQAIHGDIEPAVEFDSVNVLLKRVEGEKKIQFLKKMLEEFGTA